MPEGKTGRFQEADAGEVFQGEIGAGEDTGEDAGAAGAGEVGAGGLEEDCGVMGLDGQGCGGYGQGGL